MFSLGLDTLTKVKVNEENKDEPSLYPDRPGERDCHYFLRTGKCGYGSSCRYNHPVSHVPEVCEIYFFVADSSCLHIIS